VPIASVGTGLGIDVLGIIPTFVICAMFEVAALLALLAPGFRAASIDS
jgi:hypothetical protein